MHANERTPLYDAATPSRVAPGTRRPRARLIKIAVAVSLVCLVGWLIFAPSAKDATESAAAPAAADESWVCGNTSRQEAGYVKLANKEDDHYFYWFEASAHEPSTDPLVLWLTGGPGVSSMTALLTENGPCSVNKDLTTTANAYSWSNRANMIWLDQPTGTGFSYSTSPADSDKDEDNVGENVYWFLQGFLATHPEFDGREFFITGESYGGHYVPGAAHYIWQQNQAANASKATKHINLQGIAIGNGLVDPVIQYDHYVDQADNSYNITLLTEEQIEQMRKDQKECIAITKLCQAAPLNGTACTDGEACWATKLLAPFLDARRNSYDIRQKCDGGARVGAIPVCGFEFGTLQEYLALDPVRDFLGVDVPEWVVSNLDVQRAFIDSGDWSFSYHTYVADMLDDGIRVLIYAGDADLVCNWTGNQAWVKALEWAGKDAFNAAEEKPFIARDPLAADGEAVSAGVVRSFENFAFVRVFEAGHMVPTNQPAASLDMINKFFANEAL